MAGLGLHFVSREKSKKKYCSLYQKQIAVAVTAVEYTVGSSFFSLFCSAKECLFEKIRSHAGDDDDDDARKDACDEGEIHSHARFGDTFVIWNPKHMLYR